MADQTFQNTDKTGASANQGWASPGNPGSNPGSTSPGTQGSAPYGFEKAASAAKSLADQAAAASRDLKEKAAGMAGSSTGAIKDRASEAMDAAKDMASQATDKLKQTVDDRKNAGADYVGNLADTMRRAAREFDQDLPIAGAYIRKAASQIEGVSDQIKTGNFNDLIQGAQSFARRQPTAFLGLAVLAGFGMVRFLKSSSNSSGAFSWQNESGRSWQNDNRGAEFTANQASRSYSDNMGYRDEFTK
jgi:hypothetical protein